MNNLHSYFIDVYYGIGHLLGTLGRVTKQIVLCPHLNSYCALEQGTPTTAVKECLWSVFELDSLPALSEI